MDSDTDCVPAVATVPDQPSPLMPPVAVHCSAPATFQLNSVLSPKDSESVEAVKAMASTAALGAVNAPVLPGSSTDRSVVVPVLLVVSAVDCQTADIEVKSAAPLVPLGAGGFATGHIP